MDDAATIFAIATARSPADRQMLRLSGPGVARVVGELIEGGDALVAQGRGVRGVWLRLSERGRVPAIAMYMPAPGTFTGEAMAEIIVPGSMALGVMITQRVLGMRDEQGGVIVRPALAGEFSSRALANGKVKAEQLEGIAMLLAAASSAEHHAGMRLLRGEIGSLIEACTQRLLRLLALLEAGIDFSDQEDVVPIEASELLREVAWVVGQLEVMGEQGGSWVQDAGRQGAVPLVMLAGPPNAGKSTLMNAMLAAGTKARQREMGSQRGGGAVDDQARRSVMGVMAGTTRDLLTARLTLTQRRGEVHVELMDAPGIEEAPKKDDAGLATLIQQRTMEAIGQADVLLICSATGDFDSLLREVEPVAKPGAARILVRTKADRPRLATDGGTGTLRADVEMCGLTGLGIGRLKELIAERVRPLPSSIWPERLVQGFAEARGHLMDVIKQIEAERCHSNEAKRGLRSMEILAHHLRGAHDSLAQIHGPVQADAILGRIFSSFCIGK